MRRRSRPPIANFGDLRETFHGRLGVAVLSGRPAPPLYCLLHLANRAGGLMGRTFAWVIAALLFVTTRAVADVKVMVAVDPSDRESIVISVMDLQAQLSRVTGQSVSAIRSEDLGDVMRSTRTGEYDLYIAPRTLPPRRSATVTS